MSTNSPRELLRTVAAAVARIPRYIVLVPVYAYRWLISPMLPDTCIYTPSCSHYTVESILHHGAFKGLLLGIARVLRCTGGFFMGGHDPVPAEFSFAEIRAGYRRHSLRRATGKAAEEKKRTDSA